MKNKDNDAWIAIVAFIVMLLVLIFSCYSMDKSSREVIRVTHHLPIVDKQESGLFQNKYFVLSCSAGKFVWKVKTEDYLTHNVGDLYAIVIYNYDDTGACSSELWEETQYVRSLSE